MINQQEFLGYVSGILMLLSFGPYIRDIFRGTTKPERASWLIWSILNLISLSSQWSKGASYSLWLVVGQEVGDIAVFLLALVYGVGGFHPKDCVALMAAAFGLFLWYITNEAATALFITIAIDAIGAYLTVEKAYRQPTTETMSGWILTGIAGFLAVLSVASVSVTLLVWPVYICILGFAVTTAMLLGSRHTKNIH